MASDALLGAYDSAARLTVRVGLHRVLRIRKRASATVRTAKACQEDSRKDVFFLYSNLSIVEYHTFFLLEAARLFLEFLSSV